MEFRSVDSVVENFILLISRNKNILDIAIVLQVVYGTTGSVGSGDDSRVMSDKVQLLASSIYKEFETMIQKSGEDSVK
uniref:Uncharacterized protein n=1 Tax=Parascaris equorum TaxID=6256 RepID=A0A914R3U4_PAREQ